LSSLILFKAGSLGYFSRLCGDYPAMFVFYAANPPFISFWQFFIECAAYFAGALNHHAY